MSKFLHHDDAIDAVDDRAMIIPRRFLRIQPINVSLFNQ